MTGFLELEEGCESIFFCFEKGLLSAGVSTIKRLQMGRISYRRGHLQHTEVLNLPEAAKHKRVSLGKAAVKRGLFNEIVECQKTKDAQRTFNISSYSLC